MNPSEVLLLAFLIGVICGLRSLTAPAVVAWAAYLNWMHLDGTPVAFMETTAAVAVFTLLAAGELVADKLPKTPSRTKPAGLLPRITLGGLCGACVAFTGVQSIGVGILLGMLGGISGAFGGYRARTGLAKALKVPDFVIALIEDAIAIGGGLLIVSRF